MKNFGCLQGILVHVLWLKDKGNSTEIRSLFRDLLRYYPKKVIRDWIDEIIQTEERELY